MGQAFRERLAESTPSAKLMVRGRASRSRCKGDVNTKEAIADKLHDLTKSGRSQKSDGTQNFRPALFGWAHRPPAPAVKQRSAFDGSTRTQRGATMSAVVPMIRIGYPLYEC